MFIVYYIFEMFKLWYSNFYNQLAKISTNNNTNANTNVDQVTNDVVLVDISSTSTPKLTPPLHTHPHPQPKSKNRHSTKNNSAKNSYRNANKKANKNFKPPLNNSSNASPLLINDQIMSKHVNNNNINVVEFSNLFTNTFQSLVHYGDNIGAKVVKCLINENLYETQSLINQDYDIYQVRKILSFKNQPSKLRHRNIYFHE